VRILDRILSAVDRPLKAAPGTAPVEVEGGLEADVASGATEQPERRRAHVNDRITQELRTAGAPFDESYFGVACPIDRVRT